MKTVVLSCILLFVFTGGEALGHTLQETNAVVQTALWKVVASNPTDNIESDDMHELLNVPPNNWQTFFGGTTNDGWTVEGRQAAFDWYLARMCVTNCQTLAPMTLHLFQTAIFECRYLSYTNAVGPLKSLVLNPHGIDKVSAIEQIVEFSPADDSLTVFVENILTNKARFSFVERAIAGSYYAHKIRLFQPATNEQRVQKDRAAKMFYRHRLGDVTGGECMDNLFVSYFSGYEWSSNRLEFANFVLQHPECDEYDRDYFNSITNRLLNAKQSLRQLNIDARGGE